MNGYEKLKAAVVNDCNKGEGCFNPEGCNHEFHRYVPADGIDSKYVNTGCKTVCKHVSKCSHKYCDKFKWVIDRAKHYGEKLGLNWEDILNSWEERRDYWYMNYYQDSNQPEIKGDKVRVFDSAKQLQDSVGKKGFRCPSCGGVSKSPYKCDSGLEKSKGKKCDWNVGGLFGDLGKGIFVYCMEQLAGETIFMPIAWEETEVSHE